VEASDDRWRLARTRHDRLVGIERIGLANGVLGGLHDPDDLVRRGASSDPAECSGQATGHDRVPSCEEMT
jgi:hypothetical protein